MDSNDRVAALVDLSALREKHDPVARNLVTIWRSELLALIEVAEASYAFLASDYEPQAHQRLNAALDLIDFGADRALAEAWGDYLDRHRDEIAENFERAAELIRAGDTHGLAEHVGRNRRARAEAAASDSHAATGSWLQEQYPEWSPESCWNCGGHGVVSVYSHNDFEGAGECGTCGGSGQLWRSPKGRLAMYPGGPFRGS